MGQDSKVAAYFRGRNSKTLAGQEVAEAREAVRVRPRFEGLDGLRGVAAIAVLLFHLSPQNAIDFVPRGFLAVDFFFVLSGFVIASAYDDRLVEGAGNGLTVSRFLFLRLVRLYPLIVLGIVLGFIGRYKDYGPSTFLLVTGLFLVPTPFGAAIESRPAIALNPPAWSLLWELAVNMLYAVLRPALSHRALVMIVSAFAGWLVFTAFLFGTLQVGATWPSAWAGAPRAGFSFFAGVALLRARRWPVMQQMQLSLIPAAVILVALLSVRVPLAFELPLQLGGVLLVFPVIVAGCSNAAPGRLTPACAFLGAVSYPAYILQGGIVPHLRALPGHLHLGTVGATFASFGLSAIFVGFAWIALRLYDEPVRAWLTRRTPAKPVRALGASASRVMPLYQEVDALALGATSGRIDLS